MHTAGNSRARHSEKITFVYECVKSMSRQNVSKINTSMMLIDTRWYPELGSQPAHVFARGVHK